MNDELRKIGKEASVRMASFWTENGIKFHLNTKQKC
jgi:hypothetical protein